MADSVTASGDLDHIIVEETGNNSTSADDKLADNEILQNSIRTQRSDLLLILSVDYGLLDTLLSHKILSFDQYDVIRSRDTQSSRAAQLLDEYVLKMSHEHQEQFLVALGETQQTHVSNFIRANGQRTADHGDDWPLLKDIQSTEVLDTSLSKMAEMLDTRNGLLAEMLSADCITHQHENRIESKSDDNAKNHELLSILRRKSIGDFNKFIACLEKTKQGQAVSLLTGENVPNMRESPLTKHYSTLIELLDTRQGLVDEMFSVGCITPLQKKYIETAPSPSESTKRLLRLVRHGTDSDFRKFIECLNKTGQEHVARVLTEDGVICAHIVAKVKVNGVEGNTDEYEERVVQEFKSLLATSPTELRQQRANRVIRLLRQLSDDADLCDDVELIAINKDHSIGMIYMCKSLPGLLQLYEFYVSGRLEEIINKLFAELLHTENQVVVDSLDWSQSDYNRCMEYLCSTAGLSVFTDVYRLAQLQQKSFTTVELCIEKLPFEMIEMLLMKAAGQLLVTFNRMTPRAQVYTLATLSAVSRLWWTTFAYRKYTKHLFRRYSRYVNYPYKSDLQQSSSSPIRVDGGGDVWGLAEFNNKLYVVCGGSNVIRVYSIRPPFDHIDDLIVQDMTEPRDIVLWSKTNQFYIADFQGVIWRVNALLDKEVDKFVTVEWLPFSLSINSSRLLVTPRDGDALFLYGNEGQQLKHLIMPKYMRVQHAAESGRNTYIIIHCTRSFGDTQADYNGVSEVDVNGNVIRQFSSKYNVDSLQFIWPQYALLDANNHVIVADTRGERIVLLQQTDLELKRVLLRGLHGLPIRMLASKETGLLFVGCFHLDSISVFEFAAKGVVKDSTVVQNK